MPVQNSEIAQIFYQVADLLEIEGANEFRVRAYRDAARTVATLPRSASEMMEADEDLEELPGIGADLAGKIEEIVETGGLEQLEGLEERVPPELGRMLKISSLGPKRVKKLHEELGVTTFEELETAAEDEEIRTIKGLGPKIEGEILEDLKRTGYEEERTLLMVAEQAVEPLIDYLRKHENVNRVAAAGSYRRRKETVGDFDILATSDKLEEVMDHFVNYEDVDRIISQGETRSTVVLRSGLQVDLRVVGQDNYGAALLYFTGSANHNIKLRNMALDKKLKINEYGVFTEDDERIAGETEQEVYDLFDLPVIQPELREDRGEIEAAQGGNLPDLVTLDDICGDLQCHTTASDGHASLKEMAQAAKDLGYEYLAITDHSKFIGITQGLDADELAEQIDEIDRLNDDFDGFRILKAIEVDILEDGSLALPDDILEKLDLRVCSVHTHMKLSREKQTDRVIRAMDNPNFNILAHPTSRKLGERDAIEIDMDRVMEAALDRGCILEVNAQPDRLDLNDVYCRQAREMGLKLAISTDAHRVNALPYMRFGVWQARRGWLEPKDVINTRKWKDLRGLLER